jgi:heme exporter protein A
LSLIAASLWVLDEPGSNLDAQGQELLRALLASHLQAGGTAVVATHQPLALSAEQLRTLELQ